MVIAMGLALWAVMFLLAGFASDSLLFNCLAAAAALGGLAFMGLYFVGHRLIALSSRLLTVPPRAVRETVVIWSRGSVST